jgi:hypothetical protein
MSFIKQRLASGEQQMRKYGLVSDEIEKIKASYEILSISYSSDRCDPDTPPYAHVLKLKNNQKVIISYSKHTLQDRTRGIPASYHVDSNYTYWCKPGDKLTVSWYQNGLLHREDGAAYEETDRTGKSRVWYTKGQLLRSEKRYWAGVDENGEMVCRWTAWYFTQKRGPADSSDYWKLGFWSHPHKR